MKKIVLVTILTFSTWSAHAEWHPSGSYCLIEDYRACHWCLGGGPTPIGNCEKGYAGCPNEGYIVSIGSYAGGLKCTANGFCKSYCDSADVWRVADPIRNPGLEELMHQSGCLCDKWTNSTGKWRCSSGYYPDSNPYSSLCHPCPSATLSNGVTVPAGSIPGSSKTIEDCFLAGGPYKNEIGIFEVTDFCHYVK